MRRIWTDPDARARREASGKHSMDAFMSDPANVERLKARSRAWVENNPDWAARQAERAKWAMKRANEALRADTDFEARFTEVQARLRREMPYDGPKEGSDYAEYLQKLGKAVTNDPELRAIADAFMSEALPRFSAEWTRIHNPSGQKEE